MLSSVPMTLHEHGGFEYTEDGRFAYTFHQSWLNTFYACPEQARAVLAGEYPPDDTEAAAKGTAVHAAIEAVLRDLILPDEAISLAFKTFRDIAAQPHFRYVKTLKENTCLSHIEGAFASWWDYVYPQLKATVWVENEFKFLVHEDDRRLIYWGGSADYAEEGRIDDWKVSSNKDKYGEKFGQDGWEQKRWAIQPTIYCAAYQRQFGTMPQFRFVNLDVRGREPQFLTVERTLGQAEFLVEQCIDIAELIETMGVQHVGWPTNDQHALCSPKWCLKWDICKGRFM